MTLTPADVRAVRFTKAPFDADEVDAFLDMVAQTLIALHDELSAPSGSPPPAYGTSTAAETAMRLELDTIKQRLTRLEALQS